MTLIIFVLIISVLILIHEFGHFLAAKKMGVKVEEFGLGFPPRLFGIKKGETLYSINALPIGGFVKLYGEEYYQTENSKLKSRAFVYKYPFQKAIIITAGVIGNFLLGWFLISFLFTQGVPTPINKVIIEKVQNHSPAQAVDLQDGDIITSLLLPTPQKKLIPIKSTGDLITLSKKYAGKKITLIIERDGKKISKTIIPRKNPPAGQGPLGIIITSFVEKKYPWYQAPFYGLIEAFKITKQIVVELIKTLIQFVSGQRISAEVTGPVGIARYTTQIIKFGKNALMEFIALLSLNLAVINILPFPALDGGRLFLVIYEWITKKSVNKTFEKYLNFFGIIFLLTLAGIITINDIIKIYK